MAKPDKTQPLGKSKLKGETQKEAGKLPRQSTFPTSFAMA
jgi:hypothetical protein